MDYFCCDIYVHGAPLAANDGGVDVRKEQTIDRPSLDIWLAKLFAFIDKRTAGFVWNREPLQLFVDTQSKIPRISGRMIHGDAVDDEWLAVWLLREASREFHELTISVRDTDGEFLLAEAAMHIPHWLTPENSENRVFMHKGRLHIIPLAQAAAAGGPASEIIGVQSALGAVVDPSRPTLAPAPAEDAAFARLARYPDGIRESVHRARCKLPVSIAHALAEDPQLIAAAVEAFYSRDPAQTKAFGRMERFPPEPSAMVAVRFNRVQYAKLASHGVRAPAAFQLPPPDSPDYKASVLGMKVACGFENLARGFEIQARGSQDASCTGDEVAGAVGFLQLLDRFGYFDSEQAAPEAHAKRRAHAARAFAAGQRFV